MRKILGKIIMIVGGVMIFFALLLTVFCSYQEVKAGEWADTARDRLISRIPGYSEKLTVTNKKDDDSRAVPVYELNPDVKMSTIPVTVNTIELNYIGILRAPSIGLELPVIADWSYYNLNFAPCCFSGSAYQGNFVICAHNYAAHFGSLDRISPDDTIVFTDIGGNNFFYTVESIDILEPADIDEMISEEYDLTLFTCTFSGQARVAVRCKKTE